MPLAAPGAAVLGNAPYAADQLFATLDTTTRKLQLPGIARPVALSDTVEALRTNEKQLVTYHHSLSGSVQL